MRIATQEKKLKTGPHFLIVRVFFCVISILAIAGCDQLGFSLEQTIRDAVVQAEEGDPSGAINKLESLQDKHPDNPMVAEALGVAYRERGSYVLSANYFQKAARLSSSYQFLMKNSAESLVLADRKQDAVDRLLEYLRNFPEDGENWLSAGRLQSELQDFEASADSLTKGILLSDPDNVEANDYLTLGEVYLQLGDYPQADFYLNQALDSGSGTSVEAAALIGLTKTSLFQQDLDVADLLLQRLRSKNPALYETPDVKVMRAELDEALAAKRNQVQSRFDPSEIIREEEPVEQTPSNLGAVDKAIENQQQDAELPPEGSVIEADMENIPESGDSPQEEPIAEDEITPTDEPVVDSPPVEEASVENPIADLNSASESQQDLVEENADPLSETSESVEETEESGGTPEGTLDPEEAEANPYVAPENEDELLLVKAKQYLREGDVPAAIRMSWDAIHANSESPAAWFILSRAYAEYGQYLNAEAAALESIRINSANKTIVLNYLAILQRSRSATRFHEELLKIYRVYNREPEFILALARSYARIHNDYENASALYRRFLDVAPDHPRVEEVRQELTYVE